MRLFIALKLSKKQQHEVGALQSKLKSFLQGVKWVRPENMHLTLKFLGETDSSSVHHIKKALEKAASCQSTFRLGFGKTGVFPNPRKARVLWIDLDSGKDETHNIAEKVQNCLFEEGFPKENRDFQPHLTIGRIRTPIARDQLNVFLEQERSFRTSVESVNEIVLFQSILDRYGASYKEIHKIPLT